MKLLALLLIIFSLNIRAQDFTPYNQSRLDLNKKLMIGLTSWSITNIGVSSLGWATTEGESKYFHQMNVAWSGVNLALSIPGLIKARKPSPTDLTTSQIFQLQSTDEKVFLFNAGLDIGYIIGGFYLKERSKNTPEYYHRFRGWGNSIILQGSFLFLFDLTAVLLHSSNRKKKLYPMLDKIDLGFTGNGVNLRFNL